ncbi:MAG: glycosyltransferase family 2 protein [Cenarchaeum sp. SB0665_bin_23]|nr:glycosyltransferase family 2 protein [Cenarchaeum sp. SB0665_bin_23]
MGQPQVSIILPTYNESQNILRILHSIEKSIPDAISAQTIVVDDNSPDGTGRIVEEYLRNMIGTVGYTVEIIHRRAKTSLGSAILHGIQHARGDTIIVMDSDFSHPPNIIPKLIEALRTRCDIVVASRYIRGGKIDGWPVKRKIISRFGTIIAKNVLNIKAADPMSGFFAFRKNLLEGIIFDGLGFKILMEILVKVQGARIVEIPYTFQDRERGDSKLNGNVIKEYCKSIWRLYRYGGAEPSRSVRFISKAARFYTVGTSGFLINYVISLLLTQQIPEFWYLHANILGIASAMSSNYILNKIWTFQDRDFSPRRILTQFEKIVGFSSQGAAVQLGIVFSLEEGGWSYPASLSIGVLTAALGNYMLNKKLTFKEKLWG